MNGYPDWKPGSFLSELPPAIRERVLALGTQREFRDQHTFIHEGGRDTEIYLLLSGTVKVTCAAERAEGGTALLAIRVAGDIVGEFAAIDEKPRSAAATSVGTVKVREISRRTFTSLLAHEPAVSALFMKSVTGKTRDATSRRVDFTSFDAETRFARVLVYLADHHGRVTATGTVIEHGLTQAELGTLAGVNTSTVERALRRWRAEGLIAPGGYLALTVIRMELLRKHARQE